MALISPIANTLDLRHRCVTTATEPSETRPREDQQEPKLYDETRNSTKVGRLERSKRREKTVRARLEAEAMPQRASSTHLHTHSSFGILFLTTPIITNTNSALPSQLATMGFCIVTAVEHDWDGDGDGDGDGGSKFTIDGYQYLVGKSGHILFFLPQMHKDHASTTDALPPPPRQAQEPRHPALSQRELSNR